MIGDKHLATPDRLTTLDALLRRCTVRIITPAGFGTGFFVSPGFVLTCAHVLEDSDRGIEVVWGARSLNAAMTCIANAQSPDLALIRILQIDHPCALLNLDAAAGDQLYCYGYTDEYPNGDSALFVYEGPTGANDVLMRLRSSQVRPGLSGSPLLNVRTGSVCGLVEKSRDRHSDLGGRGLPIAAAFSEFPQLLEAHNVFHALSHEWTSHVNEPKAFRPATERISLARLPVTGRRLFGRTQELVILDDAWTHQETGIISIIAWGGVGKSALVNHWLRSFAKTDYEGADRVFAWSFYRQGTGGSAISADDFVDTALKWFGDPDPASGSAWDKGERLANLVRKQRTLLILDGLEPLQFPPGPQEGALRDPALQALFRELASFNPGLCIITTRLTVHELADFATSCVELNLDSLSPNAGAELLRSLGVKGELNELEQASIDFDGHCLALTLLGTYLVEAQFGDIGRRAGVDWWDDNLPGNHARRVMKSYERWFGEGPETSLLRLMGLFDRPADFGAIEALREAPAIPGLTGAVMGLRPEQWRSLVSRLRRTCLLADDDVNAPNALDAHPLVREYFRERLVTELPDAWREANARLFRYYSATADELPETLQDMQPLFLAVAHGCNAGLHGEAYRDVYLPRIMRDDESFAVRRLGARGALLTTLEHFFDDGDWGKPVTPSALSQGLTTTEQMAVLAHAGLQLTATEGYSSTAVIRCYARLNELASRSGNVHLLYAALISEWRNSLVTDSLSNTLHLAQRTYDLAATAGEKALLVGAYRALADTLFFMGRLREGQDAAVRGITTWRSGDFIESVEEVTAPVVTCFCFDALAASTFGRTGAAQQQITAAVTLARELNDMHALAVALYFQGFLAHFAADADELLRISADLIQVSLTQGFAFWLAGGEVQQGWAVARLGRQDEGIEQIRRGIAQWRATNSRLIVPYWLGMLAEVLLDAGRTSESERAIDEAIAAAEKSGELWWITELYRMKAELLMGHGASTEAWALLDTAQRIAEREGAVLFCSRIDGTFSRHARLSGGEGDHGQGQRPRTVIPAGEDLLS